MNKKMKKILVNSIIILSLFIMSMVVADLALGDHADEFFNIRTFFDNWENSFKSSTGEL